VLIDRKPAVDAFWAAEPRTLVHGDTHLGNLFFEGATPGFLDWQAVMAGPGIRDLAYFVTASVDAPVARDIERGLVDRYAERLARGGVDADADHLWTRYRAVVAEFYISAVMTSGTGDRMQPEAISRVGVERAVAAVQALDTFEVLTALVAGEPV
jgi:aminoglycoside phosphotransferase (APT) family kinase protein